MAQNIGDLYFSLGLDESKLKQQWNKALKDFKEQKITIPIEFVTTQVANNMKAQLGQVVQQIEKVPPIIKKSSEESKKWKKDIQEIKEQVKGIGTNFNESTARINAMKDAVKDLKERLGGVVSIAKQYFSVWQAIRAARSIVQITGEIEYQRKALESVMQSAESATKIWRQIQNLSIKSPFQIPDLIKYSKQLSAFGIENEHLFDTLKSLADVSAGLGVDLSRIALAYGEINAAQVLRGKETRQLTQAGIPIIKELAKQFSELEGRVISVGEVYEKIFSRQVSFDMVKKVFQDLTSEGGKFYQMQEKQAATLRGSIKNLADYWTIMANEIGSANSEWMKSIVSWLKSLMKNWKELIPIIRTGLLIFASYKTITIAAASLKVFASSILLIKNALQQTTLTAKATSLVTATQPWIALAGVIITVVAALTRLSKASDGLAKIQNSVTSGINNVSLAVRNAEIDLDLLWQRYKNAKKGTDEYRIALNELQNAYPEYFNKLEKEGQLVGDLVLNYDELKKAAIEAARARALTDAVENLKTTRDEAIKDVIDPTQKAGGIFSRKRFKEADTYTGTRTIYDQTTQEYITVPFTARRTGTKYENVKAFANYLSIEQEKVIMQYAMNAKNYTADMVRTIINASDRLNKKEKEVVFKMIEKTRAAYDARITEYTKGVERFETLFGKEGKTGGDTVELLSWQKTINKILDNRGLKDQSVYINSEDQSVTDLRERVQKKAKELKEEREDLKRVNADTTAIDNELAALEEIAIATNFPLDPKGNKIYNKQRDSEIAKEQKTAVDMLNQQLQWVEAVRKYYQQLKDLGMSAEEAERIVRAVYEPFANIPQGTDLHTLITEEDVAILERFKGLYDTIGTEQSAKASEDMQQRILEAQIKGILKVEAEVQKLKTDLEELGAQDWDVNGEGGLYKLSKIIVKLNNDNAKLTQQLEEQLNTAGLAFGSEEYEALKDKALELYNIRIEHNKKVAQNAIDELGDEFIKPAVKALNMAFKNVGRKSKEYLREALSEFEKIKDSDFGIFGTDAKVKIMDAFGKGTINGDIDYDAIGAMDDESFMAALNASGLDETQRKALIELRKSVQLGESVMPLLNKIAKELGVQFESAKQTYKTREDTDKLYFYFGSWASQIGGAIGGKTGSILQSLGNTYNSIQSGLKSYNNAPKGQKTAAAVSMIVEGGMQIFSAINSIRQKNKEKVRQWNDAIREATQATRLWAIEQKKYVQSNIWGVEHPFAKLKAAGQQYAEGIYQLSLAAKDIIEKGKYMKKLRKQVDAETTAQTTAGGILAGVGTGLAIGGSSAGVYGAIIGAVVGAVIGIFAGQKKVPKSNRLTDFYDYIYDPETYELNQDIINDYAKMNDETKKLIDNWQEIKEKIKEAREEMESEISDLTGNMGDDIKNLLVNAFSNGEIYDAIDDIDDYLSEMIKNIAIQTAFSSLFGTLYDELGQRMLNSFDPNSKDYDENLVDEILWFREMFPQYIQGFGEALSAIEDQMDILGLDSLLGDSGNKSTSAIASVTEETASRLLGQINAIRADVSVKREMISEYLPMIGTINDCVSDGLQVMRQIEANTYSGAQFAREIKDMINSMRSISDSSAGYALNVNIQ